MYSQPRLSNKSKSPDVNKIKVYFSSTQCLQINSVAMELTGEESLEISSLVLKYLSLEGTPITFAYITAYMVLTKASCMAIPIFMRVKKCNFPVCSEDKN